MHKKGTVRITLIIPTPYGCLHNSCKGITVREFYEDFLCDKIQKITPKQCCLGVCLYSDKFKYIESRHDKKNHH